MSQDPEDYTKDTPERVLVEFLDEWQAKNYESMEDNLRDLPNDPKFLSGQLESFELESFELLDTTEVSPVTTDASVRLDMVRLGDAETAETTVRLIRFGSGKQKPVAREDGDGTWVVTNWRKLLSAETVQSPV
jgi:hypothetical protein